MRRLRLQRSSWLILLAVALTGVVAMAPWIAGPIERALEPMRFAVQSHPASGNVAVVEMDARSVAAIRQWPWSRRHYGAVVDRLRAAGAATIVFDVDVSTPSNEADDRAFAAAIARAEGRVVLPTFAQAAGTGDERNLDALPIPVLRRHAGALASVAVAPDGDGLVRSMPYATITEGTPRPSLSAYIAARAGAADQTYPIDLSIEPDTVPRLSFVAVERGQFDPAAVRGRNVLIGATAIEMGDRYPVPLRGVLPGVTIQALAAETLLAGTPVRGTPLMPYAAALLLAALVASARDSRAGAIRLAGALAMQVALVLAAQRFWAIHYSLGLGNLMLATAAALVVARDILRRFRQGRLGDEETGLPNHRAFRLRAPSAGATAVVQVTNVEALSAVIGVDQLAQALIRTAERLRLTSADALVYRISGHQLALVLTTGQASEDSIAALRAIMLEPVEVAGRKVDVAVAIGVAEDGDLAAAALAASEAAGDGSFWRRAAINRDRLERSVSLMGELDAAIAAGEILVHYQPKLALADDRIAGVEALVRWRHPERGFVPPDAFIPLAEQTDRIAPLTLHVLSTVLADVARWRAAGHEVSAAVNISATLLGAPAFTAAVDRLLDATPVPMAALVFEVTESAALSDARAAVATLNHFRDRGIAISMDDYGTGQSTLSYLRELPLSELKIDRSFVQHAHERADDAKMVRSTIDLAHALGLRVVAEGIEEAANLAFLRDARCDYAQGYHISRPIDVEALLALLAAPRAAAA